MMDILLNKIIIYSDNIFRELQKILGKRTDVVNFGIGTGRVVKNEDPRVVYKDNEVIFVYHPYSLPHSLWRSQEYTLINKYRKYLEKQPTLDLGCGDGSFAKILFDQIDFGVDPDEVALEKAEGLNIYKKLLKVRAEATELRDNSIGSVFSNSVLEHVENLEGILQEMHRILIPGGYLLFTVPNNKLSMQLEKLFGKNEMERLNGETCFSHYNLLSNSEWINLLESIGFEILLIHNYQSQLLIQTYRRYSSMLYHKIEKIKSNGPNDSVKFKLTKLLQSSICDDNGSGTLIIAKKQE